MASEPALKKCRKCSEVKPLDQYSKHAGRRDGLQQDCKACFAEYYQQTRELQRDRATKWRRDNPELHRAAKARIRAERKAGQRDYIERGGKVCRQCNERKPMDAFGIDRVAEDGRQHFCRPCRAAQQRALRARRRETGPTVHRTEKRCPGCGAVKPVEDFYVNRSQADGREGQCKSCIAERAKTPAGRARAIQVQNQRRAAKNGAPSERIDRRAIFVRDGGVCHICGLAVDPDDWHLDHIRALSRGGTHTAGNVGVAHPTCNLQKFTS